MASGKDLESGEKEPSEKDPLLGGDKSNGCMDCCYGRTTEEEIEKEVEDEIEEFKLSSRVAHSMRTTVGDVCDEMTYRPASLLSWGSLLRPQGTIWSSGHLWRNMANLFLINILVCIAVIVAVPDPVSLKIENFLKITYFLNFFVGLLVGFFMTTSLNRWHECTSGFLELGDAIRNLQMQFQALGAPEERSQLCIRYGLLSGWFMKHQLIEEMQAVEEEDAKLARKLMWKALTADEDDTELGFRPKVDAQEVAMLKKISDPAGVMWIWITSVVARMAADGEIPAMATPTYGRIMNLAQDAHDGIRHVRTSVSVRAPFVYVHMLASLVHINNILNAFCFGMVLGIYISGSLIYHGLHYFEKKQRVRGNQVERDGAFVFVSFFVCTFGPLLYQAITEISVALTEPFGSKFGQIPIDRILLILQEDLEDGKKMAASLPHWEKPCFKQPK